MGTALGIEFSRLSITTQKLKVFNVHPIVLFLGLFRVAVLGLAGGLDYGAQFGFIFGLLTGIGLLLVYRPGFSPSSEHIVAERPVFRWKVVLGSITRGISTGTSGAVAGLLAHTTTLIVGLKVRIDAGIVGTIVSIPSPYIEWWIDRLPARRLGTIGTILLLIGLIIQSLQYWI